MWFFKSLSKTFMTIDVRATGDNMIIAALSAASWCTDWQSCAAAIAFKAAAEGV